MSDTPEKWDSMTRKQLMLTATEYRSERDAAKSDTLRAFDERNILQAENARLTSELEDERAARELLAKRLQEVCFALKGESEPGTLHSWHDLGEIALAQGLELLAANEENARLTSEVARLREERDAYKQMWELAKAIPNMTDDELAELHARAKAVADAAKP